MRPDVETATATLLGVRRRLAAADPGDAAVRELEHALGAAAVEALAADAWLLRADHRLRALAADDHAPPRDLRVTAAEREQLAEGVRALRRELAALRDEHTRLRGRDVPAPRR